jgi:transcriptional repressor NrdR
LGYIIVEDTISSIGMMLLHCPFCGYFDSKVMDSRSSEEANAIRRRRECLACQKRFTTYERIEEIPLVLIKKDGSREPFDRQKVMSGLLKACEKRPVPYAILEKLADTVERELRNRMEQEVKSTDIGELVMEGLKTIDEVAYVRFASVYRQFKDRKDWMRELQNLDKRTKETGDED